jgi:hypothetical protein
MASTDGITPINNYAGAANDKARVQLLLDAIPNPDSTSSSGSQAVPGQLQGNLNSFLDEMSPAAAVQLRVELIALGAAVS